MKEFEYKKKLGMSQTSPPPVYVFAHRAELSPLSLHRDCTRCHDTEHSSVDPEHFLLKRAPAEQ